MRNEITYKSVSRVALRTNRENADYADLGGLPFAGIQTDLSGVSRPTGRGKWSHSVRNASFGRNAGNHPLSHPVGDASLCPLGCIPNGMQVVRVDCFSTERCIPDGMQRRGQYFIPHTSYLIPHTSMPSFRPDGRPEIPDTRREVADTRREVSDTRRKVSDTRRKVSDGRRKFPDTRRKVADGRRKFPDTRREVADGRRKVADGRRKFPDGCPEVRESCRHNVPNDM
jgi:hypothetical protein